MLFSLYVWSAVCGGVGAAQPGDLSFQKGQVITVTEKSDDTNTWWRGKVGGNEGIFPANFVEVV